MLGLGMRDHVQAAVLRAFRVFVEVCILRRQPGYESAPQPPVPSSPNGNSAKGEDSGSSGELSPARTPVGAGKGPNRGNGGTSGSTGGWPAASGAGGGFGAGATRDTAAQHSSDFLGKGAFSRRGHEHLWRINADFKNNL